MAKLLFSLIVFGVSFLPVAASAIPQIPIPECPCVTNQLLTLEVDAPFARGDRYSFSIIQDRVGRPLSMAHKLYPVDSQQEIAFNPIPYQTIARGFSLFSVSPVKLPLIVPGFPVGFFIDTPSIELLFLKLKPISAQDYEITLHYKYSILRNVWRKFQAHMVYVNNRWVIRDSFGELSKLKLTAGFSGIDGIERVK